MKHYKTGFLLAFYFHFASTPVPSAVTQFPIPPLSRRGCLIACIHSVASDLLNLNLIAFLMVTGDNVSFGCRFAQIHFPDFSFFLSFSVFYYDFKFFSFPNKVEALINITATRKEVQSYRIISLL